MSAFFAVAYPNRVELLTDGAIYEDTGTLTDIRRKVWTSARHPIAVTGRGDIGVTEALANVFLWRAGMCGTVDEALAAMQGILDRRRDKGVPEDVEMVVCAISETDGPLVLYFCTADIHGNGTPLWTLIDVSPQLCGGARFDPADLAGLDATEGLKGVAVPVFNAMRRHKDVNPALPGSEPIHGVGGHIDLTTVRREGCTVERIHVWPEDQVGRRIRPVWEESLEA